ncbi:10555_t:CDS:1, partial [Cetraspora pellucida]
MASTTSTGSSSKRMNTASFSSNDLFSRSKLKHSDQEDYTDSHPQ